MLVIRRALFVITVSCFALGLGFAGTTSPAGGSLMVPPTVTASTWQANYVGTAPSGSLAETSGVSCVTSIFCMSVGAEGSSNFAQQWNGSTWTTVPSPNISGNQFTAMSGVSCVSVTSCVAVGDTETTGAAPFSPAAMTWDGSVWALHSVPAQPGANGDTVLSSVSCLSATLCIAVGSYRESGVQHAWGQQWNGSSWSIVPVADPGSAELDGISCITPTFCAAVGDYLTASNQLALLETFNGTSWTMSPQTGAPAPVANQSLHGVSCAGVNFCAAVGSGEDSFAVLNDIESVTFLWNGQSWSYESSPNVGTNLENQLNGVSCFAATSCAAVGYHNLGGGSNDNRNLALFWNGQAWTVASTPDYALEPATFGGLLAAVSCVSGWACLATGQAFDGSSTIPYNLISMIARTGYRFVASDGGVFAYGAGAPFLGSLGGTPLNAPVVGIAVMPAGDGYYLAAVDGGVFAFGSAKFHGSMGNVHLNEPIVGIEVTADGGGYWLVASDGGVFAFGDAAFYGSAGNLRLNKPVAGIAAAPNGKGYWLVASDGGIFNYGPAAPFLGSTGNITLNKPVVGIAATTTGQYYLVATDGGIFAFPSGPGGLPFLGSTGNLHLNKPIVGMTAVQGGYYLSGADGGIFAYPTGAGGLPFYGSTGNIVLNKPIVGVAS